jgi:hypothetical protein
MQERTHPVVKVEIEFTGDEWSNLVSFAEQTGIPVEKAVVFIIDSWCSYANTTVSNNTMASGVVSAVPIVYSGQSVTNTMASGMGADVKYFTYGGE